MMRFKKYTLLVTLLIVKTIAYSQPREREFKFYNAVYPISEGPNMGYKSSLVDSETILFEANPTMRFSFANTFVKMLDGRKNGFAIYASFRPQLRMYTDNSLPVKTPSYRILIGVQALRRINSKDLIGFSLESGHYSNGQTGGAFTEVYDDGSPESEAIYDTFTPATDLSKLLNRKSGNFSTNLTELIFNYRNNKLDGNDVPKRTHSIKIGGVLYHNRFMGIGDFGGFTAHDIKLYGRFRNLFGYQYIKTLANDWRIALSENLEVIYNAHPSVEPWRSETNFTVYPWKKMTEFGLFATYSWGHDNYNYRFVDSGGQMFIGITWDLFPPFPIKGLK